MRYLKSILILLLTIQVNAQYTDFLGAGHSNGITVSSSSQQSLAGWTETATATNTINGQGLDARTLEVSRFLAQTTFGTDLAYIENLAANLDTYTFSDWINDQFNLPVNQVSMGDLTRTIFQDAKNRYYNNGGSGFYSGPSKRHFSYAWWQINKNNDDLLRQRVALALSEIMVYSNLFDNVDDYSSSGYFYDVLVNNSFGNFRDLLLDVTLQPIMGKYLTYYNNPKGDLSVNQFPDENYAREIMQLFTIGLSELNQDGSYILDANGKRIPTYDNSEITEFAKIFTGLSAGSGLNGVQAFFGLGIGAADMSVPMAMYDGFHQQGEKHLLNGFIVPNGQTGMQDIESAIDNLFNHPNVGPFIAIRLIQRLVKSNPTPQYISSVAAAFNNTNGVRGDMKGVIRAILLHPEARSCTWINEPYQGKLREPMIRYFNLYRQIDLDNPSGLDWNDGVSYQYNTYQAPLQTRSVFSFYRPDFEPNGPISDENAGLFGPEFQINNSFTSVSYANAFDAYIKEQDALYANVSELGLANTTFDFTRLKYLAKDSDVLINHLDKLFTHGLLSDDTYQLIKTAIDSFIGTDDATMLNKSKIALWLILMSPDYAILK
jgi:uncharacterized protein (DUF1800 family)